ncbi:MAG: hypothetical protein M3P26_06160 [Gemmatimonadota bacterium]|nr:hypothetical protein [Gemmatimonadota bacterium]
MSGKSTRDYFASSVADQTKLVPEIGALNQWQREIRVGSRKLTDADQLWRAACAEANAREWTWYPPTCNHFRLQAAEILRQLHPELTARRVSSPFAALRPAKLRWNFAR